MALTSAQMEKDEERSREAIESQIEALRIPTDRDVIELYLGRMKLTQVMQLDRFRNLHVLWLNANKLRSVDFLLGNERLSELHLEGNLISRFDGGLVHLTGLRILTLQRNQLVNLELLMRELIHMQALERLSLAHNPVSQETDYRHYVIYYLPYLQVLDRQEITPKERLHADRIYNQSAELVRQRMAFGSKLADKVYTDIIDPSLPQPMKSPVHPEIGNNFFRQNPLYSAPDEAIEARRLKKSLMELTRLDWSKMPRYSERRQSASQAEREVKKNISTSASSNSQRTISILAPKVIPELVTLRIKS